jgi:drug/metabolite transporter (DMT)-like permease
MIVAIAVALASAVAYGVSDFFGGFSSARLRVAPTSFIAYGLATVTGAVALVFAGGAWSPGAIAWGALAGLFAITGTLALYGALVAGPVSLGTPIVGTLESAVPVIAAVLFGHRMTGVTWVAIALAVVGGALVPLRLGSGERLTPRAALLAVAGGLLFGGSILALSRAPHDAGLVPAVFEGGVGFVVMALSLAAARMSEPLDRLLRLLDAQADAPAGAPRAGAAHHPGAVRRYLPLLATGVLQGLGNTLLVVALGLGELAIVTVLADLYPVPTVLLARFVLRERLSPVQLGGVVLALAASALFALA